MDSLRGERSDDRLGERPGDRSSDWGRQSTLPSRWSSGGPTNQLHRHAGGGGGDEMGGGGFYEGRFHPYRVNPYYPPAGGGRGGVHGFRAGQEFRDGPGGFGSHQMMMGGNKHGFPGRGGSPEYGEGNKFAKLFIGSVPTTATEEDIRPLFEKHGDVIEVALIRDKRTGQQQGCCFIKYGTPDHAERAIRALHNQYILPGGTGPIQVRYADGERERLGTVEDKLFVASLNKLANEKDVEEIFSPYGHVEDVYLMKDEMKRSRGCGFVKFSSRSMALAAMNALHGTYVMRGCDQPLIVRFADPKRPRPMDQRAFGGPSFGPRPDAVISNSELNKFDAPDGNQIPRMGRGPRSPQSGGPPSQSSAYGFGSYSSAKGGLAPNLSSGPGPFGDDVGPTNGSLPNLAPVASSSQQSFDPSIAQLPPPVGQQMLPLHKSLTGSQNLPPSSLFSAPNTQAQAMQAPVQQPGQFQLPQSIGLNSFSHGSLAQPFPGLSGQLSAPSSLNQQNVSAAAMQNHLNLPQQGMTSGSSQPQFPVSNISQHSVQQLPSQMLLQQQAQTLQSSYQSSQQAIFQIQQQLQMMQQSNLNLQQNSLGAKLQTQWTGQAPASSTPAIPASMPAAAIPATPTLPLPLSAPVGTVTLSCNWTEHTSPEGFKYYYNSATRESKWEKPEELTIFEQQQQQQKLLLLQQQQLLLLQQQQLQLQKITPPPHQSPSHAPSQTQVQPIPQASLSQLHPQLQIRQQGQLQMLQPSLPYQASGAAGQSTNIQDVSYAHLPGTGSVPDSSRGQQGIQVAQEWAWKNNPSGS